MKEIFDELFYIPKHQKIREKTMLTRVAVSITIIVICLAAMGISAYAFFSHSIASNSNIIKTAKFEADVSINIIEKDSSTLVDVKKENNISYTADLKANKTYNVVLSKGQNSTATTGFCVVSATNCKDIFHSQQIGEDASAEKGYTDKVEFQLKVTADTTVTFLSHWGTSSYYDDYKSKGDNEKLYITQNKKIEMNINATGKQNVETNKEVESTTQSTENSTSSKVSSTQVSESNTTSSTETNISSKTTNSANTETNESTVTTEPSTSTTESATSQPSQSIETKETESTEPAETESTETQSATESTWTTGIPII